MNKILLWLKDKIQWWLIRFEEKAEKEKPIEPFKDNGGFEGHW